MNYKFWVALLICCLVSAEEPSSRKFKLPEPLRLINEIPLNAKLSDLRSALVSLCETDECRIDQILLALRQSLVLLNALEKKIDHESLQRAHQYQELSEKIHHV